MKPTPTPTLSSLRLHERSFKGIVTTGGRLLSTCAARPLRQYDNAGGFGGTSNARGEPSTSSFSADGSCSLQLRRLLQGQRTAILWDLDNVDFFAPACTGPLQVRRLRALVAEAGASLALCRAYGNLDTVRRLSGVLPLLEVRGLLSVEPVAVRRDAADVRLVHDAMEFAATHGSGAALLCVSQDTDFAGPLRYLSERSVRTVAVSPHDPRRRTHAAMEPATYFRRLPLPAACWAALKWEPRPVPVTPAEAAWFRSCLASASLSGSEKAQNGQPTGEPYFASAAAVPAAVARTGAVVRTSTDWESYTRAGARCRGAVTRLWLNPEFGGALRGPVPS